MKFHPAADLFPLLEGAEFDALVGDIRDHGLRVPIVLHEGMVLDGRNRWRACQKLGVEPTTEEWSGRGSPISFVLSTNLHRRHLDESQRAMVGARAKHLFEEEARARQGTRTDLRANLPEGHRARDDAAALVNVSARSVESAAKVLREGAPELVKAVDGGQVAVSTAAVLAEAPQEDQRVIVARGEKEILKAAAEIKAKKFEEKRAAKLQVAAQIAAEPVPLPTVGPFRVIVLDPPWKYEKRADDPTHRATLPYPDMTIEQICALPVASLAHDDCILWLWTTNAFMRDSYQCLDAWGFREKTILTWVKNKMGTGDWLRGKTEHCILAVRGKPIVTLTNQTTVLEADAREHSRKPDSFYSLVEELCPGSKLEMFARETRDGWASWGAESSKFDQASRRNLQ